MPARPQTRALLGRLAQRARIAALPVGVSVAVHVVLLLLVATVTWQIVVAPPGPPLAGEVLIDLEDPAISTEPLRAPAPAPARAPAPIAPAPEPKPPAETGRSASLTAPPPRLEPAPRENVDLEPLRRRGGISFAGVKAARAASVVYVVDTSGAMASSYALIVNELERSLSRLDPTQLFQVVSFRDRSIIDPDDAEKATLMAESAGLAPATPRNRAEVVRALRERIVPSGRSDPAPALELALSLRPDAVFLLTRSIRRTGPGQENDEPPPDGPPQPWSETWRDRLLDRLVTLNPRGPQGRRTLIKAIQFLDHDPTGTLQAIGAEHGGEGGYVVRSPEDLERLADAPPPPELQIRQSIARAALRLDELASGALDWNVLFGITTARERGRAASLAEGALDQLGDPGATEDPQALLQMARSALLLARVDADARAEAVELASRALDRLAGDDDERATWHRDHLRLLLASFDLQSPPRVPPPPWEDRDLHIEHALATARAASADDLPSATQELLAQLGSPPFADQGGWTEPALVVLAIDAIVARAMQIARAQSPPDPQWVRFAIDQILLLRARDEIEPAQREALVLDRIDRLLTPEIDPRELQPEATLALARRELRGDDPRAAEPLLREILIRDDADHLAPRALSALADLLASDESVRRRSQAPLVLMTLHAGWPDAPEAESAVQRALFLSERVLDSAPPGDRTTALNAFHQILRDAKKLPDLDNGQYWLARHDEILLELAKRHDSTFSLHLLEEIRPGSPQAEEAVAMYRRLVRAAIEQMHELHLATRGVPGREDDAEVSLENAARHARHALALYSAHGVADDTAWERESLARTYALMGLPQQELEALEAVLPYADEIEGGPVALQMRIALLEKQLGLDAEAFARLRALSESLQPAQQQFWQAWAVMLEILRDQNASGERSGAILAHIGMLRTLDDDLGGEPWRGRILAVAQSPRP